MSNDSIRIRVCLAVVKDHLILLVPHFDTDKGPVQWNLPGGQIRFGEALKDAAVREVREETGINAEVIELLDVSEVFLPERPYHSLTITYLARPVAGKLRAEADHPFRIKEPRWFSMDELGGILFHPEAVIRKAFRAF